MAAGGMYGRQAMPPSFQTNRAGQYFNDRDFVPRPEILCDKDRYSGNIFWRRPKEICRDPRFILDGVKRHDLDQGSIGNCWFISAAANLTIGEKSRFDRVVPPGQDFGPNYTGFFRFNFWWHGQWTEVVVDDYLPTRGGKLIYCRNKEYPNEFWPALLEKAYAKLRGSYQALVGGHAQDAMVDLTGGISEVVDISNKANIPADLYNLMLGSHAMDSMQVAAVWKSEATRESVRSGGLVAGHAYSITKFQQLIKGRTTIQLVRLRNPWGKKEWNGAWSDTSVEMRSLPDHIKNIMGVRTKDEGEFWMSFQDLVQNFDLIQLCHLSVDSMTPELRANTSKSRWNVMKHQSEWTRGGTAGGSSDYPQTFWKNPQFYVELREADTVNNQKGKCTLFVSLMQQRGSHNAFSIGFKIYRLRQLYPRRLDAHSAAMYTFPGTKDSGFEGYREITRRFELPPGYYVVIPCTYRPEEAAKFLLRLYTEKPAHSRKL